GGYAIVVIETRRKNLLYISSIVVQIIPIKERDLIIKKKNGLFDSKIWEGVAEIQSDVRPSSRRMHSLQI
ncbi:hypothetical protein LINPERHAP1_LOCUS4032, partial [Linum perenne]